MVMIDSDRLKFFLGAAQDAKVAWVAAGEALLHSEQALNLYNSKARDVTTLVMLLIKQAKYEVSPVEA